MNHFHSGTALPTMIFFVLFINFAGAKNIEKMEGYELVGEYRYRFAFFSVYDAKLYAPDGKFDFNKKFALKLEYLIGLKGKKIAKRSVMEMKKQGFGYKDKLNKWLKVMESIFPDVKDGDYIMGIKDDNGYARFYSKGEIIGVVKDREFARQFFNIWLNEKTSEPKMRKKLLGL
jgi:hypothetical protein